MVPRNRTRLSLSLLLTSFEGAKRSQGPTSTNFLLFSLSLSICHLSCDLIFEYVTHAYSTGIKGDFFSMTSSLIYLLVL